MTPARPEPASDILAFYAEAGVDTCLGEMPVDRLSGDAAGERAHAAVPTMPSPTTGDDDLRRTPEARPATGIPLVASARRVTASDGPAPLPPDEAAMGARAAAKGAATLEELRAILDKFEGCTLRGTAKQLVFADGNPQARVMFVGEAPGRDEDIEGLPFVGRSGKLLDRMNAAIGLDRSTVYIANIVPWRPPGNRTPTPQEASICLPFLLRQIELVDPDILVCLGGPSAQTLLGMKDGIKRLRGRWFDFDTGTRRIRAIATFHPAYLLRTPLEKRYAWRDFLAVRKALGRIDIQVIH